jgi:hypothetical protein
MEDCSAGFPKEDILAGERARPELNSASWSRRPANHRMPSLFNDVLFVRRHLAYASISLHLTP